MGWATGSEIAERLWKELKPFIKSERALAKTSKIIIDVFEEYDADDWGYQLQYKDSLYYTYMKLNEPKEFKELMKELYD